MRVYVSTFRDVAIAAAQDFFDVAPAANKPCKLLGFTLANVGGTADAGDAAEEDLALSVIRGYATRTGGTANTPAAVVAGMAAAGASVTTQNTTVASAGTPIIVGEHGWNTRVEYQMFYPDELAPVFDAADTRLVVRCVNAPADSFDVSGAIWFAELR